MISDAVQKFHGDLTVADIMRQCPDVGIDMVRHVLKVLQGKGMVA